MFHDHKSICLHDPITTHDYRINSSKMKGESEREKRKSDLSVGQAKFSYSVYEEREIDLSLYDKRKAIDC